MAKIYPADTGPDLDPPDDEDEISEIWQRIKEQAEAGIEDVDPSATEKSGNYPEIDDCLLDAFEKTVQWGVTEDSPDFSKTPRVWENDGEVPEYAREAVKQALKSNVVWSGYDELPPSAQAYVMEVLREAMVEEGGWTLEELIDRIVERYDVPESYAANVMRNESAAVLNEAREQVYEERADSDKYVYDWIGPNDHRTTDTCLEIEEEIEDRGGAVPMDVLKDILYAKAREHSDEEGTPGRARNFQPHFQCRRTFVRRVQSI
jgi:hypothetical protein